MCHLHLVLSMVCNARVCTSWPAAHAHVGCMFAHAGFQVPYLQEMAQRLTCMISSSGANERSWSTYEFIHSPKRNRLLPSRANDLVYVFSNMRLMAKFGEPEKFADRVAEEVPSDEDVEHARDEYEAGRSSDDEDAGSLRSSDLEEASDESESESE